MHFDAHGGFPGEMSVHFITRKSVKTDRRRPSTDLRREPFLQAGAEWFA
jgi:hypothetical protein